jgi:two-component system invasion response regulator UvrY
MIKFLIVDDHAVVRRGLKQILSEEYDMSVFGEARNAEEMFKNVREKNWDIVILDITMPGRSGLDVLKELKHVRPKIPVLVLSIHPEEQYAVRVLKLAGAGYMTKESAPDELVKAVRKVLRGGKYVSPSLAEKLAFDLVTESEKPLHERLSNREYQVLCMIASGKSLKEIARELYLSEKTIRTYKGRILDKMGLKSNADLIYYAVKNRLVD